MVVWLQLYSCPGPVFIKNNTDIKYATILKKGDSWLWACHFILLFYFFLSMTLDVVNVYFQVSHQFSSPQPHFNLEWFCIQPGSWGRFLILSPHNHPRFPAGETPEGDSTLSLHWSLSTYLACLGFRGQLMRNRSCP